MNKSAITKTLKKVESQDKEYSLGFRRLLSLPAKARKSFNLACLLDGAELSDIHQKQKEFLGALSGNDFKLWLAVNA